MISYCKNKIFHSSYLLSLQAIVARDLSRTDTEPTVTSGGVGENHVTIQFKSGRGEKINYLILIFSNNI